MKKIFCYIIIMFVFAQTGISLAQKDYNNSVKGIITDKQNKPVAGAVCYLSQTCYYSTTDANGNFEIKNIVPGNYTLAVTVKNFLPVTSNMFIDKGNPYTFNCSLNVMPTDEQARFASAVPSGFDSDYMKFERVFIGTTPYMGSCKVENPEVMRFKWNEDVINGSSNGPIVFVHKKFGYKLHCVVNSFSYDTRQLGRTLDFTVYFESMKPKDDDEKEDWDDYRKEAYNGSINHFLWAFRQDELEKEEYEVFSLRTLGNEAFSSDGTDAASEAGNQFQNRIRHFSEISIGAIDENQIMFSITGFLKVVHKPRSYSKEISFLQVPSQSTMTLDKEGWTDLDMPFVCYGLWGKNGISNLLPKEYRAKK